MYTPRETGKTRDIRKNENRERTDRMNSFFLLILIVELATTTFGSYG